MNSTQLGVITLLKSAVTQQSYPLPVDFALEAALPLLKSHDVSALAYSGAVICGADRHCAPMQQLFQIYCTRILFSERQMKAVQAIYSAFDAAGIHYMPVKGCNLKQLYPEPGTRTMGDADILIRLEQYGQIRSIMESLGYCEGAESDHELIWKSKALCVELHKRLIPSFNKDYFRYYGDGWQLASRSEGTHWYMTDEDQLVYLVTHFAKHYRSGGIGLRHVLDLWLFPRSCPALNEQYIHSQLKTLGLDTFYCNLQKLIAAWFEDGPTDERTELIGQYIMESGSWGRFEQIALSSGLFKASPDNALQKGQRRWSIRIIFPPLSQMQYTYRFLKKHPAALPAAWVMRWIDVLRLRPQSVARRIKEARLMSADNLSRQEQLLNYMGLTFDFKE